MPLSKMQEIRNTINLVSKKCKDSIEIINKCKYSSITGQFNTPLDFQKYAEQQMLNNENSMQRKVRIQNYNQRVSKWHKEKQQ